MPDHDTAPGGSPGAGRPPHDAPSLEPAPAWPSPARTALPGLLLVAVALAENALWGDAGLAVSEGVVTAVPVGAALSLRHRNPAGGLFVVAAVVMAQALSTRSDRTTPILLAYLAALTFLSYLVGFGGTAGTVAWRWALFPTGVQVAGSAVIAALTHEMPAWLFGLVILVIFGLVPGLFGRDRSRQRQLVEAGWSQVAQLEWEQRMIAQQTRLTERARIAQDMHDSLGHELSLLALRAGALEMTPSLDESHRAMFGELRSVVTAATERLTQIIGVLSEDAERSAVDPVYDDVHHLVERARALGMKIELRVDGEEHRPPVMVERATYRVLQESLTNAAKHAPGAAVTVLIVHFPTETTVTVGNGRPSGVPRAPKSRGQRGLLGLKERARLLGGTFEAGPRDGGYQVVARLPHDRTETGRAP